MGQVANHIVSITSVDRADGWASAPASFHLPPFPRRLSGECGGFLKGSRGYDHPIHVLFEVGVSIYEGSFVARPCNNLGKPQRILLLTVSSFTVPMISFYLVFISLVVALGGFVYGVDSGK